MKVQAEKGFDPHNDLDVKSLRFGASEEVNYGGGTTVVETEKEGRDLILVFSGQGSGIKADNFAGKLLGKTSDGKLLFGWSRLPGVKYIEPIFSARRPRLTRTDDGQEVQVEVQNFGQVKSNQVTVKILLGTNDGDQRLASGSIPKLKPFEKATIPLECNPQRQEDQAANATVRIEDKGKLMSSFSCTLARDQPEGNRDE